MKVHHVLAALTGTMQPVIEGADFPAEPAPVKGTRLKS